MPQRSEQDETNRRGCFSMAAAVVIAIILLGVLGLGLLGQTDSGKPPEVPSTDIKRTPR